VFCQVLSYQYHVGLRAFARLTGLVPLLVLPVSCLCSSYRFRASLLVHRVMSHASLIRADSTHLCTFPYHLRHSRCPPHFPFFVCSFCALSCLAMSLNNFHFTNLSIIVILEEPVTRVLGSGIGRRSGVGRVASAIEMIALPPSIIWPNLLLNTSVATCTVVRGEACEGIFTLGGVHMSITQCFPVDYITILHVCFCLLNVINKICLFLLTKCHK